MSTVTAPASTTRPTSAVGPAGADLLDTTPADDARGLPTPTGEVRNRTADVVVALRSAAILVLAGAGVWWSVPRVTGVTWGAVGDLMTSLRWATVLGLTVLWIAGLYLHSYVLTASLPGLSHRRAMTLNLTGSAVSNLLPGGGAAGVATNLMMMRRWSVPPASFAAFTLVSNVWDVVAKLLLPGLAVALALLADRAPLPVLVTLAVVTLAGLAGAALVACGLHRRARTTGTATGPETTGVAHSARETGAGSHNDQSEWATTRTAPRLRRVPSAAATLAANALHDVRCSWPLALVTVRRRWPQLTLGMAGYVASQAVLLGACLAAVGAPATAAVVAAAFAVERLASLVPITPAGTGLAEAGALSVLVALGCAPVPAAAGVLLYRLFTVLLEIPVGAAWLAGWTHRTAVAGRSR